MYLAGSRDYQCFAPLRHCRISFSHFSFFTALFSRLTTRTCKRIPAVYLQCTYDGSRSNWNVCKMSFTPFSLVVIFIVRVSTSSYFTQSKALKHQCILTNQLAAMQSKFTSTFCQNNTKESITNSEIHEIEQLFLKVLYERPATIVFFVFQTRPDSPLHESLDILWRKCKLLHHHLSQHRRWRNWRKSGREQCGCLFIRLKTDTPFCNKVNDRLGHRWGICLKLVTPCRHSWSGVVTKEKLQAISKILN